jgi:uncharacterized protein
MVTPLVLGRANDADVHLLPALGNRHGCITGATGTGKTVTLQRLAEQFSSVGVPVFLADVKGDLSGLGAAGQLSPKLKERLERLSLSVPEFRASPVTFWDVFGERGHPIRATISDIGPLVLGRLLGLNETQEGVLNLAFKLADDEGLLLLDLKDLRAILSYVAENQSTLRTTYGNVSAASVGAIQRALTQVEQEGGERLFGEPMLDILDLMQTDASGRGVINILSADKLLRTPRVYACLLLWLLAELFEQLPEVGDLDKPKFVFFFDEAHLLFNDAPKALLEKIELVVRLIRSKGVGVYFVTQSPLDIPENVLGQLGHRVQHALRAFTPRDQKAVRAVADTMRPNPSIDIRSAIVELGVGEALVSVLDDKGSPTITERIWIAPPASQIGPLEPAAQKALMESSLVRGVYEETVDRVSAFERLRARAEPPAPQRSGSSEDPKSTRSEEAQGPARSRPESGGLGDVLLGRTGPRGGRHPGLLESLAKSAARTLGSSLAREITRGIFGSLLGSKRKR